MDNDPCKIDVLYTASHSFNMIMLLEASERTENIAMSNSQVNY